MDLIQDINHLLKNSISQRLKLDGVYACLPATKCRRQTTCCMMLPEITLIEALVALDRIKKMDASGQMQILEKLLKYFFLNPVEIRSCPFLDDQSCLIYADRFFGCRAYGLWSRNAYEKLSSRSQAAKGHLQKQWANLGVMLPDAVTGFQVPYCPYVEITEGNEISDRKLDEIAERIDLISRQFSREDNAFRRHYFLDLSFLVATWTYGYTKAVELKFAFVKDFLSSGNRAELDNMITDISNVLPSSEPLFSFLKKGEQHGM